MGTTGSASDGVTASSIITTGLEGWLARVSPYTVGTAGTMSQEDFNNYETLALLEYNRLKPDGFDSSWDNYCKALLIAHIYQTSTGNLDLTGEKIGDYSYSKKAGGESTYMLRLNQLFTQYADIVEKGIERDDTKLPNQFRLDQEDIEGVAFDTDNVEEL